jgi:hypothetical protein
MVIEKSVSVDVRGVNSVTQSYNSYKKKSWLYR